MREPAPVKFESAQFIISAQKEQDSKWRNWRKT